MPFHRKFWLAAAAMSVLLFLYVFPAEGQTDTLTVHRAAGKPGERVLVPITLTNTGTIAGLQMKLQSASKALAIDSLMTTARTQGMQIHWNPANGTIIMIDLSMKHMIAAGYGPILNARYRIDAAAQPDSVRIKAVETVLSDPSGRAVSVKTLEGGLAIVFQKKIWIRLRAPYRVPVRDTSP